MKQISLEDSSPSSSHTSKYGSIRPHLPLSITGKPTLIQAMKTVDPKFRVPSRRSITSDYLPKLHEQIINKLKTTCSSADFL
ncbi:unnamed protein product [Rotaria sordida]|uniref:Uncharacterized protein n=1 Tax=Rotaria sordida TaxID=392033 RepID=A0A814M7R8_9BILA|nr:unnamed protein product [Rotaria sordida]CAF1075926.1 unnamed protein product [Rotaria sordida]CAF4304397.1 unnamed protein product [Rotaria sordida]